MQQPAAIYAAHHLQLKILDCTDENARHANAETKIAVHHTAMKHLEAQSAETAGDKLKALIKDKLASPASTSASALSSTSTPACSLHMIIKEKITTTHSASPRRRASATPST